ncbi:IS1 family transposase, partial [Escherichia coli]
AKSSRNVLNLTTCFSRSVEIHEKVIGSLIKKHMFY